MEISYQKRLFCDIYYVQNNFFIKFLRKCNFFAFLAAYHLRGRLFFCSEISLLELSNRGYWLSIKIFFEFLALLVLSHWLLLRGANAKKYKFFGAMLIFFASSPATNWGDIFFHYALLDLIFSQSLREERLNFAFWLLFLSSIFHLKLHRASSKIKSKSCMKGGKNRHSGLSFVKQY